MPLPPTVERRIAAIRDDRMRGAAELAEVAAEALLLTIDLAPEALADAARLVMAAQPVMAPLVNLARAATSASDPRAVIQTFVARLRESASRIAVHAAPLIPEGGAVLTHSSSAAVFETLRLAWSQGKRFRAFATESRPLCEGTALARRLGREGVPAILIVDAAFTSVLPETALVLVGADSVSSRGLVNKTGTAAIALAASALHVPMYALCGSQKFLPEGYELPPEPLKDPREILNEPAENVSVRNYYFDLTPLDRLTGLVTEAGIRRAGSS